VVSVGGNAGHTKAVQAVKLDKHISLIDSPGILFGGDDDDDASLVLRNALRVEQVADPAAAAAGIVARCPMQQLMQVYSIGAYKDTDEFLVSIKYVII
jgi:nuclear GTP-binding protein